MLTEALEGVSDLLASGLLLVGVRRSSGSPDKTHPFGYGREIYFWTLLSALIMFGITATMSLYLGWQRFLHPQPLENTNLALFVLSITVLTNGYAFFLSCKRLLRRRGFAQFIRIFYRSSLVETKTTFILDLMGTVASMVGIIALTIYQFTGNARLDGIGAMAIGVVLAGFSYLLVAGIRDLVVGRSASAEVEEIIKTATMRVPNVTDVLDLKTMHVGSERLLVHLDVHLKSSLTTREIEKLIDTIKAEVQRDVPAVKHIQVELETPER